MERVFVFTVWEGGEATEYATVLPPEVFSKAGASGEAIVGTLPRDNGIAGFVPNEEFTRFLQQVVAAHAPTTPGFDAEAKRVGSGWVNVIDRRTPTPGGPVPPEDIIGGFQVANGRAVPGSYSPNTAHQLLTERGFFNLEDDLHAKLVSELVARSTQAR
jgi:hypothetical protein